MHSVIETAQPANSLIAEQAKLAGYVTDCFSVDVPRTVDLTNFIDAFYKTPLFRLERILLMFSRQKGGCGMPMLQRWPKVKSNEYLFGS